MSTVDETTQDTLEFGRLQDEFSRRRGIARVCVGPDATGSPNHIGGPFILDTAHIGGRSIDPPDSR